MKILKYTIIIFLIITGIKLIIIIFDNKIADYNTKQYHRKTKKRIYRGNIYDRNNILLQYTKLKYIKNKYIMSKRIYPSPSYLSITGLVNNENHGLSGLEMTFDNELITTIPISFFSRLWRNDIFTNKEYHFEKKKIETTIDKKMSKIVYEILKKNVEKFNSEYAIAVIMDGENGDILAISQYPQYHPNHEISIDTKYIYPLAVTQSYEIGSIIKVFLMLSALEEGIVNEDSMIDCYGVKEKIFHGKKLTTWKAHGIIPFWQVIRESNNFGVAQLGLKLSHKLYDYYKSFGFGEKLGIEIGGENSGILHHPKSWSKRSALSMSFGYEMNCSLLQLVSAWSIFINDGKRVLPHLLKNKPIEIKKTLCNKSTIEKALPILHMNKKNLKKFGLNKPFEGEIYGKTGTANLLINNKYDTSKNSYCFVGHTTKQLHNKIIGIYVKEANSNKNKIFASQVALPIFLDIITTVN